MKPLAYALALTGLCASAALTTPTPAHALETYQAQLEASDAASQARVDMMNAFGPKVLKPGQYLWRQVPANAGAERVVISLSDQLAYLYRGDELMAVKDPVVQRTEGGWRAWICCHPLDTADEDDRMTTAYATSADGLEWEWHGMALSPRPGRWDARGARVSAVLPDGRAAYDGRATKDENWFERTGLAGPAGDPGRLVQTNEAPISHVRYLDVLPLPGGGYRIWYEAPLPGESHELRTELIAP